ncbi:insoluble domain protein [Rhodococcus sp. IEGM 1379]|uniref:insoluble domain protein n=1 Tax=Rhodococcus sp. IEGM 1379 TaxID=3047086 RepID=UPI0024B7D66B|nr:insoluble domain protein [Rhodococcus sp. IEGM 1379]MDI9915403.1 insoluble domain protein [Rhodococcus sp. IEGM 1379]
MATLDITSGNRAARRAQHSGQRRRRSAARQGTVAVVACAAVAAGIALAPSAMAVPGQAGITDGGGQAGIAQGGGQSGVTTEAPAPAPVVPGQPEPTYWVEPPVEYQNIAYQPLANFDYNTNTYTPPTNYDATSIDYSQLHLPGPVEIIAPIIAPRDTLRFGTFHIAQPNWVSDADLERTNNTTSIVESMVATFWHSTGVPLGKASRESAAQIAGTASGALAGAVTVAAPFAAGGALIGGTIGGNIGMGLGNVLVPGAGWVPGGIAGTAAGAGIGAAMAGAPAALFGAVGGGAAGFVAATAYGAGELGVPVDVEVPDVDQPAVTTQAQNVLTEWENSGPIGQAAATTVRDTVAAAPAIDAQVRGFVAVQPGGEAVIEQVDAALTDSLLNASPGLASTLISQAVGAGVLA